MTAQAEKPKSTEEFQKEIERLERLLEEEKNLRQEAQETIEAIRTGAVDGIVRSTAEGEQVFILKGSDQPYRNLIEKMNEGAILLSDSGVILYCNMGWLMLRLIASWERILGIGFLLVLLKFSTISSKAMEKTAIECLKLHFRIQNKSWFPLKYQLAKYPWIQLMPQRL